MIEESTMITLRTTGPLLAAALCLGLSLTGCGGSDGDAKANSAAQGGGSTDKSAALVKYSECMRQNGVPSFPDPVDGRLQMRIEPGSDLDPDGPAFKKAQEACKSMEPPGLSNGSGGSGEQQEQMLKYVACMRKNGVPKFPDPQGGGIKLTPDSGVDPQSPAFKKAEEACKSLMSGGS
jgi:hypothetical protein